MHEEFEKRHVHSFYSEMAAEFSSTRNKPWPMLSEFYRKHVKGGELTLDAGSGNGRNTEYPERTVSLDYSAELLRISQKKMQCISHCRGDLSQRLPFRSNLFSVVLSIAVLPHIVSHGRRTAALRELHRVAREGGILFVCVWSDTPVGQELKLAPILDMEDRSGIVPLGGEEEMAENDVFVQWKKKNRLNRYYHLFREGELESLVREAGFSVMESGCDYGNHYAVCEK
jgi:tRNA (uracil-5-)-methyltransferase TRM9